MAEDPRLIAGDPESAGPGPVPVPPEDFGEMPAQAPQAPAPRWAYLLTALLPGAGHVALGAWARGLALILVWGLFLAATWLAYDDLRALLDAGTLDDWIALATLLGAAVLVYGLAFRDLLIRHRPRAVGGDSQWRIAARHFQRNRLALVGLAVLVLLYFVALLAPFLAPYDPIEQIDIVRTRYLPPSLDHWFGTDQFGRDVLSRVLYGARISLAIGFIATAIAITLGTLLGAVAGYLGSRADTLIMRFTDVVLAFPRLVLLILVVALFEPSLTLMIVVLGLTQWPGTTRIVRGEVLSLREREFIQAARALGMGKTRIILRHLVPNVLAPVIVAATLGIGNTIVLEAGLSFLGLGIQPPTPSWGSIVAEGKQNLIGAWWVTTFPGLAIVVTVLAFNLVGDGLRDALDPRLR